MPKQVYNYQLAGNCIDKIKDVFKRNGYVSTHLQSRRTQHRDDHGKYKYGFPNKYFICQAWLENRVLYLSDVDLWRCNDDETFKILKEIYCKEMPEQMGRDADDPNWHYHLEKIEYSYEAKNHPILHKFETSRTHQIGCTRGVWFRAICVQARRGARELIERINNTPNVNFFLWTKGDYYQKKSVVEWLTGDKNYNVTHINKVFYGFDTLSNGTRYGSRYDFSEMPCKPQCGFYRKDCSKPIYRLIGAGSMKRICFLHSDAPIVVDYGIRDIIKVRPDGTNGATALSIPAYDGDDEKDYFNDDGERVGAKEGKPALEYAISLLNGFNEKIQGSKRYKGLAPSRAQRSQPVGSSGMERRRRRMIDYIEAMVNGSSI